MSERWGGRREREGGREGERGGREGGRKEGRGREGGRELELIEMRASITGNQSNYNHWNKSKT